MKFSSWTLLRNSIGGMSDGATLFPILFLLATQHEFSLAKLLISAGIIYLVAGITFRVPMAVQPLKSIAITAGSIGATSTEIRLSAALLGACCIILTLFNVDAIAERIPVSIIHGLQLSLGVLLILKGVELGVHHGGLDPIKIGIGLLTALGTAVGVVILSEVSRFPFLGIAATAGLLWSMAWAGLAPELAPIAGLKKDTPIRLEIILFLVIPQLALTLGNSVLGTASAAKHYFGAQAKRVTPRNLLLSIGLGNLISVPFGGMPFCHGSGGLTAHVKGGATNWSSNVFIAALLTLVAVSGFQNRLVYPPVLLSGLLIVIGLFHLTLARQTWERTDGKIKLILMCLPAVLFRNLIWSVLAGIAIEFTLNLVAHNAEEGT